MGDYCGALACLVLLVVIIVCFARRSRRDHFYTEHGQEEPTRSYTPYTGTIPFGLWGTLPWAEAVPLPRGGESRCDTSLWSMCAASRPHCKTCKGYLRYHDAIQRTHPHRFVGETLFDLLPGAPRV